MDSVRIIEIKESVFADNDREADRVRAKLKEEKTFLLNLMSSPGSGKTTTLLRTIERLKDDLRIGVMEADIDSSVDAETIARAGVKSIQLHTGGMCHLDAGMTEQGLTELGTADVDLAVLENVGNLVCPAEFDTGAVKNAMILSVPEGHDKPLKSSSPCATRSSSTRSMCCRISILTWTRCASTRCGATPVWRYSRSPPRPARASRPGQTGSKSRSGTGRRNESKKTEQSFLTAPFFYGERRVI